MIYKDVDQLNDQFWNHTPLTYISGSETVEVPLSQKLDENGLPENVDTTLPWVRWTILPGASVADTTGPNPYYKNLGTAVLQVFLPKGMGSAVARDILESFFAPLRKYRSADKELRVYKTETSKGSDKTFHQQNGTIFYTSKRRA